MVIIFVWFAPILSLSKKKKKEMTIYHEIYFIFSLIPHSGDWRITLVELHKIEAVGSFKTTIICDELFEKRKFEKILTTPFGYSKDLARKDEVIEAEISNDGNNLVDENKEEQDMFVRNCTENVNQYKPSIEDLLCKSLVFLVQCSS